jgi:hypothetical protein
MAEVTPAPGLPLLLVLRASIMGLPGEGGWRAVLVARCHTPGDIRALQEGLLYRVRRSRAWIPGIVGYRPPGVAREYSRGLWARGDILDGGIPSVYQVIYKYRRQGHK